MAAFCHQIAIFWVQKYKFETKLPNKNIKICTFADDKTTERMKYKDLFIDFDDTLQSPTFVVSSLQEIMKIL